MAVAAPTPAATAPDPAPLILGGVPYSAESLAAKLLRWTVDAVAEREGGPPDAIVLSYPANWGPYKLDLLRQAIRLALQPILGTADYEALCASHRDLAAAEQELRAAADDAARLRAAARWAAADARHTKLLSLLP